ncbi:MAG: hypothetical protein LBT60_06790 [Oscillospiraceae bacterium]|nr:hypothetical protein [Oscillospiraceae bacterium]
MAKLFLEKVTSPLRDKRADTNVRDYVKELLASQSLPPEELAALQRVRLEALLRVCAETVPAYRLPEDETADTPAAFWKTVRPLTRAALRNHGGDYLAAGADRETLIPAMTGGTSGPPARFFTDRVTAERHEAARQRGLSWWGVKPGSRGAVLWGSPREWERFGGKEARRREWWLKDRLVLPACPLRAADMAEHIRKLNRFRPAYIMGYASSLYAFAQRMEAKGLILDFTPKVVLSAYEMLFDFQRETIARAFACPVASEYSARDAGVLAFECPQGGLHIASENVLLEVLEPEGFVPMPVGQTGLLAVTDLNNLSMPRLRYVLGDMAALSGVPCSCGLSLPLLVPPEGRVEELLLTPWGRLVHGHAFVRLARLSPSVRRFQLVQRGPERVVLKIDRDLSRPEDDTEEFIAKARSMLPGMTVDVLMADDIPLTPSGKHCYALREPDPDFDEAPEPSPDLDLDLDFDSDYPAPEAGA